MKKQELLIKKMNEAIDYFVADTSRRCTDVGMCRYSGKTLGLKTKGCMIGCLLPAKDRIALDNGSCTDFSTIVKERPDLFPKYMKDNTLLWDSLQCLHDVHVNWTKEGLSNIGKDLLKSICKKHDIPTDKINALN